VKLGNTPLLRLVFMAMWTLCDTLLVNRGAVQSVKTRIVILHCMTLTDGVKQTLCKFYYPLGEQIHGVGTLTIGYAIAKLFANLFLAIQLMVRVLW